MDADSNTRINGRCMCGAVRFEVRGPFRDIIACHCRECRRMSGHYAAATAARPENLTLLEDAELRWYRASDAAARGFCARCGSSLFWKPDSGDRVSVYVGSLDHTHGLRLAAHIFVAEKGEYYDVPGDEEVEVCAGSSGRLAFAR